MKRKYLIPIIVGIIILIVIFAIIKKNNPSFLSGKEVIQLDESSFAQVKLVIGDYLTEEEYLEHKAQLALGPQPNSYTVGSKNVAGHEVEVIYLGEVGILGEKLDIQYIDTETHLDEERYTQYLINQGIASDFIVIPNRDKKLELNKPFIKQENRIKESSDSISDDSVSDNSEVQDLEDDDQQQADDDNKDNEDNEDNNNQDASDTVSDNLPDNNPEPEPTPVIDSNRSSVKEFVKAENSAAKFNYVIYAPENANSNTPIFLFLHGIGQNGASYSTFIKDITFLKFLINGNWAPNIIIVAPILPAGCKWRNESASIGTLLNEVIRNYGGNLGNMYIGGFSAGCDGITPIAQDINFRGALYMAGYLGGVGNTYSVNEFLKLWKNKPVYFFRDSLYGSGGYGYVPSYVSQVEASAASYGIEFLHIDMHWPHRSSMIDAVLLPSYFTDVNGNYCHDALNEMIY